jgi:hypothetical protein
MLLKTLRALITYEGSYSLYMLIARVIALLHILVIVLAAGAALIGIYLALSDVLGLPGY